MHCNSHNNVHCDILFILSTCIHPWLNTQHIIAARAIGTYRLQLVNMMFPPSFIINLHSRQPFVTTASLPLLWFAHYSQPPLSPCLIVSGIYYRICSSTQLQPRLDCELTACVCSVISCYLSSSSNSATARLQFNIYMPNGTVGTCLTHCLQISIHIICNFRSFL